MAERKTAAPRAEVEEQAIPEVPQEPPANLGTDELLAGQGDNAPPPPERVPVEDLGLDALLGVDGQAAETE